MQIDIAFQMDGAINEILSRWDGQCATSGFRQVIDGFVERRAVIGQ